MRQSRFARSAGARTAVVAVVFVALLLLDTAFAGDASRNREVEQEKIELPVVFNFLKGLDRDDARINALVAAMLKRANEVLKPAGVTLTKGKVNKNVRGKGNEDENAEVTKTEAKALMKEGLKEVTGKDTDGKKKTGLKVTICKKLTEFKVKVEDEDGEMEDAKPVGIANASGDNPWVCVAKTSETQPHTEGETLAHELGHALGGLPDLYDDEDSNRLMYGYTERRSGLKLTEDEIKKIREGAKKAGGRVVKADPVAPETPKSEKARAGGSETRNVESSLPDPINPPFIPWYFDSYVDLPDVPKSGPVMLPAFPINVAVIATPTLPQVPVMPFSLFVAIDTDNDLATGSPFDGLRGAEHIVVAQVNPPLTVAPAMVLSFSPDGAPFPPQTVPPFVMHPMMLTHDPNVAAETGLQPVPEPVDGALTLKGEIPPDILSLFIPGPEARVRVATSLAPDPGVTLAVDSFFDVAYMIRYSQPMPSLMASIGAAEPGDLVTLFGGNMTPGEQVRVSINDDPIAEIFVGPSGAFVFDTALHPLYFGADGHGFDFITMTSESGTAMTWLTVNKGGPCIVGDINGDCAVDGNDLAIVLGQWGPCPGCDADLTGDGFVDGNDLVIVLGNWTG